MAVALMLRRCAQEAVILSVRPYVRRELPGWGRIYNLVADYRCDWFWQHGPIRSVTGRLHGYRMRLDLSKWSDRSTYFLERWVNLEIQLFLKGVLHPGDTVVDVGANRGNFALCAARFVGPSGKVICFEPNPLCVDTLRDAIGDNLIENISIREMALGEHIGSLPLSVPNINSGEGTLGQSRYASNATKIFEVPVEIGDAQLTTDVPRVIKLDVEGYEPFVLRGLAKTIARTKPIIITEVVAGHLEACGSSIGELITIMHDYGYAGSRIHLKGRGSNRTWHLSPFAGEDGCDVVWR